MLIIGLMSGTSADGTEAVLVHIERHDGRLSATVIHRLTVSYDPDMRQAILSACDPASGRVADLCVLSAALGELFANAALAVANEGGIEMTEVEAIASHGQTVWHQPDPVEVGGVHARGTLQIGDPAIIAARTGCKVVSDFRTADMAAGGHGAPLVPYADWALLTSAEETRVVLNLGGIANLTYLPRAASINEVRAFDTGPGNVVIDELVREFTAGREQYDVDGEWAGRGSVHAGLLDELLAHPYFAAVPPKSTGREVFGKFYALSLIKRAQSLDLRRADIVATATAMTAESIARAIPEWIGPLSRVDTVIVGGGGTRNDTLMKMLTERLSPGRITTHEEFGISSTAKEAMAFAILGYETLHGRPSNVPSATGASRPVILGSITPKPI